MSYRTIVVGTDGSESSLRAVDRAAAIAAQEKAKLVIASAHLDTSEKGGWSRPPSPDRLIDGRAADSLGGRELPDAWECLRVRDPSGRPRTSEGRRRA